MAQYDSHDAAKVIHADYVRRRKEAGDVASKYPAMLPWDQLSESYREANRHQADHISVKLRAVECVVISTNEVKSKPEANWSDEEIETLSKMEHQRWNANRLLEGWQFGTRDDFRKRHPNLVPWEDLDEATRDYDRNAVKQIPELIRLTQKVIVRA